MGAPIGLLMVAGVVVGGLVLAASSNASAKPGGSASPTGLGGMIPGHQYKLVFNSDKVSRNAPSLAAQQSLAQSVAQLGFTRVTLAPDPNDQNLFTWRATATWDGSRPTLADGLGVRFVSFVDLDAVAPPVQSKYDAGMSLAQQQMVDAMLATSADPALLHTTADGLRRLGFPIAAAALDAKANTLPNQPVGPQPLPQFPPLVPPVPPPPVSPFTPPAPPFVPPFVPQPPAPPFVPQPPAPPFVPPFVPPAPPGPVAPQAYKPRRALPPLGDLPNGTYIVTPQHRLDQQQLAHWAAAVSPPSFSVADIDGIIGEHTQEATQLAQAWCNDNLGTTLGLDGLFGAKTRAALSAAGFNP